MDKEKSLKETLSRLFALLVIILSGFAIIKWKEYEYKLITASK